MIDILLLVIMASYAISGYRQGLAVSALSLTGFLFGALIAMTLVPPLSSVLPSGLERSFAVLVAVLLFAWLGQLAGAMAGSKLRDKLKQGPAEIDQMLGAIAGVAAVSLVMWFVGGALRGSPSQLVNRTVASSRVLTVVDAVVPGQLTTLAESFRAAVSGGSFPRVFKGIEPILPVDSPNPKPIAPAVLRQAEQSIVKITGDAKACGRGQEGSGSVIGQARVVTNAHVVAGVRNPMVHVIGIEQAYPARVVLFDSSRDIAVLFVPGLRAPALKIGSDLTHGDDAVVAGYPQNGPFTAGAARIRAVLRASGQDIYGHEGAVRDVYSLYAKVEPGNSGGPVLAPDGSLVGIVFAKSLDDPNTGYALTMNESLTDITSGMVTGARVSTGGCASG